MACHLNSLCFVRDTKPGCNCCSKRFPQKTESKHLRRHCPPERPTVHGLGNAAIVPCGLYRIDNRRRQEAADRIFDNFADQLVDIAGAQTGANGIVDDNPIVFTHFARQCVEPVENGVATMCAAINQDQRLTYAGIVARPPSILCRKDEHDAADQFVTRKSTQRMPDDCFTAKRQVLFRCCITHAFTAAGGGDNQPHAHIAIWLWRHQSRSRVSSPVFDLSGCGALT